MARQYDQIYAIKENVERFAGEDARDKVMEGSEAIIASAKPEKVAQWVKGAMDRLDALVDEPRRSQIIMMNCGYNCSMHNQGVIGKAKARRR